MNEEHKEEAVQDVTSAVETLLVNSKESGTEEAYSGQAQEILLFGSPSLRESSASIPEVTEDVKRLAADLTSTLIYYGGAGLAAPQIGKNLCLVALRENAPENAPPENVSKHVFYVRVMINPKIISQEGSFSMMEGCLSIPGAYGTVDRSATVVVSYLDLQGNQQQKEFTGLQAVAMQHELEHLEGKLFVDHLSAFLRSRALTKHRKVMTKAYRQAKKSLR